jgi:glycosyltransferase involved in cell wall biosynthesis
LLKNISAYRIKNNHGCLTMLESSILLVMPIPVREVDGRYGFDRQTCAGLVSWANNFDRIIMACPRLPAHMAAAYKDTSDTWQAVADLPCADRIELVPLPYAYKASEFIRTYGATSQLLRTKIQSAQYLCFAIGGLIGDWAGVACQTAITLQRPYAIWADRVEYEVIRRTWSEESLKHQIKYMAILPLMQRYHRNWIQHSTVGLFQGQDCYTAYAPFCSAPYCVYDVHTKRSDQIDPITLTGKFTTLTAGQPLQICYVGRAAEMKGPFDWLRALHRVTEAGVDWRATWLGDGPLLADMQALAQELGIADRIHFGGFVTDHSQILATLRHHHLLLFCHKTPESPRCLVEALVSGCPIVGYGTAYSEGLVTDYGGGEFVPLHQWEQLADVIIALDADRPKLKQLAQAAARSGQQFDEDTVFRHRSDLIKHHLSSLPTPLLSIA